MNANNDNDNKTNGRCMWAEALQNPIYLAAVREAQIASDAVFKLPGPTNHRTNEPPDQRTTGPTNHRTTEPTNQRTTEPTDQRTNEQVNRSKK